MTTIATTLTAVALSAAMLGTTPTPAPVPDAETNTLVVFSENVSNVVLETPHATATRLAQMHTGDLLDLVEPETVSAAWGEMWHVRLDDGTTGYISSKVVVPLPTTRMSDLTQMSMIVSPDAGNASWLSGLAAGSSTAFLYPHTLSDRVGVPALGDVLECNTVDTLGTAGMLGEVSFRACDVNGTLSYIRTEHVAPLPDLTTVEWTGSITTSQETPVYSSPAASKDTAPTGLIPADVTVQIGAPSGAFTPVRLDGEEAWAPTKILMGIESLSDKIKEKAGAAWNKTKEVASDAKDAVTDKIADTDIKKPAVVSQVADVPALLLSGILALLTLALAWTRKLWALPIPRIARRALNAAAVAPLVMLASLAPIASYPWTLWVVLGITAAVAAGVLSGFTPDLKRTPAVARTRKAQVIAGVAVVGGALIGALVTGFAGWLAPVVTAIVAAAAAAGYLLSAPEKDVDESPAAPIDETLPEVEEETE